MPSPSSALIPRITSPTLLTQLPSPLPYPSPLPSHVQVDTLVLDELVGVREPLSAVLRELRRVELDLSLVSTQWLLLSFVQALPTETALRVWDLLFAVGSRALIAAALATVRLLAPRLLGAAGSFEGLYTTLKQPHRHTLDADVFVRVLYAELRDLPETALVTLRTRHRATVTLRIRERAAERERYKVEKATKAANAAKVGAQPQRARRASRFSPATARLARHVSFEATRRLAPIRQWLGQRPALGFALVALTLALLLPALVHLVEARRTGHMHPAPIAAVPVRGAHGAGAGSVAGGLGFGHSHGGGSMRERLTKPRQLTKPRSHHGFGHRHGGGAVATLGGSLAVRAHAAVARGCRAFEGFVRALRRRQPLRSASRRLSAWTQLRPWQRLADDTRDRRLQREHQSGHGKVANIPPLANSPSPSETLVR